MGDYTSTNAIISECQRYRYALSRTWAGFFDGGHLKFVMLNPSTADAETDDPTIRRCVGFARREGFQGMTIINLFAFRSPNPADLLGAIDPVGPMNDDTIKRIVSKGGPVVVAWGANKHPEVQNRTKSVTPLLSRYAERVVCLGTTADGSPRHPLYIKRDQPLIPFEARND